MPPNGQYGRTVPAVANILPELVFDLAEDQRQPRSLGKTETPVNLLAVLACDLMPSEAVPVLQLSVRLRPGATTEEVARDLFRLYAAVNRLDLSLRGAGLTPDDASCEATPTGATMRLTFKPTDPSGSLERLTGLVRAINEADNGHRPPDDALRYPSIESCEAQVIQAAA
jgi:hypothetical protein